MRELSTRLTLFYKYILIVIWIVFFGCLTYKAVVLKMGEGSSYHHYIVVWGVIALFILFTVSNIKKVLLKKDKLIVSNFFRSEEINLSNIKGINGTTYLSPKLIWFTLKKRSTFGVKNYIYSPIQKYTRTKQASYGSGVIRRTEH